MKFMIPFLVAALPVAAAAQSQSAQAPDAPGVALPKTTEVMVILTPRQGVTRQQIMAIMPSEIRETVKLYLDGKIRQWYSRGDGKGVIFLIDAKTQDGRKRSWKPCRSPKSIDGSRIYSGRTLDAAAGIVGSGSAAVISCADRYGFTFKVHFGAVGFDPTGKSAGCFSRGLSSPFRKNILVFRSGKSPSLSRRPVPLEGRCATSRTRSRMRWTLEARLTGERSADGEVVWF